MEQISVLARVKHCGPGGVGAGDAVGRNVGNEDTVGFVLLDGIKDTVGASLGMLLDGSSLGMWLVEGNGETVGPVGDELVDGIGEMMG